MTDALGPGAHVLYQDFTVPTAPIGIGTLMFELFIGNRAGTFFSPATLDFSTPALNQQARVDILLALRLRFAETDNVFSFQLGVDDADIVTADAVPEPSTWLLTLGALALIGGRVRRRTTH